MKQKNNNTEKKEGFFTRLKKPYEQSMRRRINFDYASTFCIIAILMFCVFFVIFVSHFLSVLDEQTPDITSQIEYVYGQNNGVADNRLRDSLNDIVKNASDVRFVSIYTGQGDLIITTNKDLNDSTRNPFSQPGRLNNYLGGLISLFKGIYRVEYGSYNVNVTIMIAYSTEDIKRDLSFLALTMVMTLMIGLVSFSLLGHYRLRRMLSPIERMTQTVRKINSENLNLRLDLRDAKYEIRELGETINTMMDEIDNSYQKQKRFVSDVSHELRTPIAVISGYAQMLQRWGSEDPEILDESIDAISNEANNMKSLVEALLFLSRHDNKTAKYEFTQFDLSDMLKEIVKDTALIHEDFEITDKIEDGIMINADETKIRQLIRILIDNAIKYSGDSTKLDISLEKKDKNIEMSVKDYGIGIAKKDVNKIFDRFYRVDESRTKQISGYGLGLSMAKEIITIHKGKIKVKSKPGEGSMFTVLLPSKLNVK